MFCFVCSMNIFVGTYHGRGQSRFWRRNDAGTGRVFFSWLIKNGKHTWNHGSLKVKHLLTGEKELCKWTIYLPAALGASHVSVLVFQPRTPAMLCLVVPEALSPKDQLNAVCLWERLFFPLLEEGIYAAGVPWLSRWDEVVLVWPSLLEWLLDHKLVKLVPILDGENTCF